MGKKVYQYVNVGLLVDNVHTNPTYTLNRYREAMAEYIEALEMLHNCTAGIVQYHNNHDVQEYDYWTEALPRYEQEVAEAKIVMDDIETELFRICHPNV